MGWKVVEGNPFAEDELSFEDLVKTREEPKPQPAPFAASSVTEQDYSPFAAFGQTVESPASIFQRPAPKRPEGMAALADPQQYKEVAKGVPGGAVSFVGTTLQGAGAVPATAQANVQKNAQMRIGVLDRLDRGEDLRPKGFGGLATGVADPESDAISFYKSFSPEQRAAERQKLQSQLSTYRPTPLAEQPLYEAGESVQAFGKTLLPAAPGYEDAFGRQIGEGLGSLIAGLPFGAAGRIPGTIFFGAGGMGEAGTRAIAYDQAEKRAGRPGLTQDQINTAALYGVGPGTTDMLPVEALLGRLHVPTPGRKALAQAIGRIGGQAFIEGMQEGGQQFLQNLIAKGVYKPDQALSQEVRENAEVGGAVGAAAEAAKEAGGSIWQRLLGRRGHAAGTRPDAGAGASDPFAQPLTPAPGGEGVSLSPPAPIDVTFEDLIPPERRLNPPTEGPVPQAGLEPPPPSPAPAAPQVLPAQAVEAAPVRPAQMQEQFGTTQDALQLGRASQAEAAPGEPESLPMPSGSFSTQDVMMALGAPSAPEVDRDDLGYYSKALESAKALKQAKGTSDQMLSQLETAGVKNAEIESTGLDKSLLGPELAQQRRGLLAQSNAIAQLKTELGDKKNPPIPERAAQIQSELATAQPALVAATVQYAQAARTGARPVTKQEITDFLEQNRVGLKETRYGDIDPEVLALRDRRDALGKMLSPGGDRQGMSYEDISDEHERVSNEFDRAIRGYREPKWSEYSLDPANPTYRESLLSIPQESKAREARDAEEQRLNRKYWDSHRQHWTVAATPEERAEMTRLEGEMLKENERNVKNAYQSGHWRGTPNVVAHIRTGEYQDTQGRKVLNLDELQSDWGQTVREGGARDEEKIAKLKKSAQMAAEARDETERGAVRFLNLAELPPELRSEANRLGRNGRLGDGEILAEKSENVQDALTHLLVIAEREGHQLAPEVAREMRDRRDMLKNRISAASLAYAELSTAEASAPSHPLVNTTDQWVTTAMRRLIQQAVDAGVDGISITPGKVQNERFSLAKVVDTIDISDPLVDGSTRQVVLNNRSGVIASGYVDGDGKIVKGYDAFRDGAGKHLSEYIGKEMAANVLTANRRERFNTSDLEIGGEGMKATYDGIYPRILGKLLQKLDPSIKAQKTKLWPSGMSGDAAAHQQTSSNYASQGNSFQNDFIFFPLTEKAKQKIRDEGQPMFALQGFYSPAIRATEKLKQDKATPEQWWSMISKTPGVRQEELQWMGLKEWLDEQKTPVYARHLTESDGSPQVLREARKIIPKADVLDFMTQHQMELEDRLLGSAGTGGTGVTQEQIEERARELEEEIRDEMDQEAESEWYQANDPGRYEIEINEDSALDREEQKIYDQALVNYQGAKRFFDDYLRQQYPIPEIGHAIAAPKFSEFLPEGWNPDYGNPQYFYDLDHPGEADNIRNQGPYETEDEAREAAEEHKAQLIEKFENGDSGYETPDHVYHEAWGQAMRQAREELGAPEDEDGEGGGTMFRQYAIKGGSAYSEALVRFPALKGRYRSAHYSDQELVHIRFDTREGPKGDRVLFIHEIQSDLHQRSRGFGFGPEGYAKSEQTRQAQGWEGDEYQRWQALQEQTRDAYAELDMMYLPGPEGGIDPARAQEYHAKRERAESLDAQMKALTDKATQRYDAAGRYITTFRTQGAPEAPYTGNAWWELGFKRMVQYAVENNFDAIALTTPRQINQASMTPMPVAEKFYGENLPRFIEKYLKKWGVKPERAGLSGLHLGPDGQNPYYRVTDAMRESVTNEGQPLALGPGSPRPDAGVAGVRAMIGARLKAGKSVDIKHWSAVLKAAEPAAVMLPPNVKTAALARVDPVPGEPKKARAVFRSQDGSEVTLERNWADISTYRAFFLSEVGATGGLVCFVRLAAPGMTDKRLSGETRHEGLHALRALRRLAGPNWMRLLSHSKKLRILNQDLRDYLRLIGSGEYNNVEPGLTLFDAYMDRYTSRSPTDLLRAIDEESVAHMVEMYSHGLLTEEQAAPVKGILDAMITGEYAKPETEERVPADSEAAAFAGPWAKTAKQNPLIQAQKLVENGVDPQTIWKRTGWFQGADDRWRFEIDDSLASIKFDDKIISGGVGNFRTTLGAFLDHPALFKAYPFLRGLPVYLTTHMIPGEAGHKGVSDGKSREGMPPAWITVGVKGYKPQDRQKVLSALLHEVQHDIQDIENFAAGGNMQGYASGFMNRLFDGQLTDFDQRLIRADRVRSDYREWMTFAKNAALKPDDQDLRDGLTYFSNRLSQSVAFEAYQRLAGEVESREVENRRHLTSAERRETFPAPVSKDEQRVKMSWADARYSDDMLALAGPRAAGAPRGAFTTAERREAQGRSPDQIWQELGVTRGPETKWRWEIDDSAAKIIGLDKVFDKPSPGLIQRLLGRTAKTGNVKTAINVPLLNVLSHPKLYTAYPFLRQMRVDLAYGPGVVPGGMLRTRETASGGKVYRPIKASASSPEELKTVLLHEIQHYIQNREGFATGSDMPGRPDYQRPRVPEEASATALYDPARDIRKSERYAGLTPGIMSPTHAEGLAVDIMDLFEKLDTAKANGAPEADISELEGKLLGRGRLLEDAMLVRPEDYVRSAGEAEAREVESRIDMTPAERRAVRPLADLPADAIVSRDTQTRDYSKAYDTIMERAKIWKQISDRWKTAEPIGAGVSVVRPSENSLIYAKGPNEPLIEFQLYPEAGSAAPMPAFHPAFAEMPYAQQKQAMDAVLKDLQKRNMRPTISEHIVDDAFAFWAKYDPRMVAFDLRLYATEVEDMAKAQYGDDASIRYDENDGIYYITSPEMKLEAQKAAIESDKVDRQIGKVLQQLNKKYGDDYHHRMSQDEAVRLNELRIKFDELVEDSERDSVDFDDAAIFEGRTAHWRGSDMPVGVDPGIYKDLIIDEQLDRWGKLPRPGDDVDFSDLVPA